ncbi:MAG: DUF5107 domain-containing protein [Chloroflexota bacterium]|nr:DUF5107 domain-containing protein [Chloroflexota bacterium]
MEHRWKLITLAGILVLLGRASTWQHQMAYSEPTSGTGDVAITQAAPRRVPDAKVGAVQTPTPNVPSFQTETISIPTYPYADHLTYVYDPTYNMTYSTLNWDTYNGLSRTPVLCDYELLVLENEYLRVTLLPELGGRIYQMIFKPTGHNELYQNPVIKPTRWGPPEQGWWLAAGGIEWCLPVEEHGYEWGEPWSYQDVSSTAGITVTLRDTTATDRIRATVTVHLPAGRSYLVITPRVENPTGDDIDYKYWINGMLAPGASNTVGADLHFVLNAEEMSVHSTGDDRLPGHDTITAGPDYRFSWPIYAGTDFSRLGNWHEWLGFFEYPRAAADFAGVYDTAANEGLARVFPSNVVQGSKGFGFGWSDPVESNNWTDDGSTYVELHGGVAPTFWDVATIPAGQALEWTEYWFPVSDIGQLSVATTEAALGVRESDDRFHIGVHPTAPHAAGRSTLYVWEQDSCTGLARWELPDVSPGAPFTTSVATGGLDLTNTSFVYLDDEENLLAALNPHDCLPPTSSPEPLPPWVETTTFTVTWAGQDAWIGIATYDVQVRDGYEGTWTDWFTHTTATSGTFAGVHGHTYFFRTRARDPYGNQETYDLDNEEWGETFTTVLTDPAPVLVTSRKLATPRIFGSDQTVTYTVLISNTGNLTSTAALTDTISTSMIVLTETLAATPGLTLVYPGDILHWTGMVTPGSEVHVTYRLSPTTTTPFGVPLTNTVRISGSVLGGFTRQETAVQAHLVWLPLVVQEWGQ